MGADRANKLGSMRSLQARIFSALRRLNTPRDRKAHLIVAGCLLMFEAVFCSVIVLKVPCKSPVPLAQ